MFSPDRAFSGFAVDDLDAARTFYRDVLGMEVVDDNPMGFPELVLPSGAHVFIYPREHHEPAVYTILNFPVDDVDTAVDDLNSRGVVTKIYDDAEFPTDSRGIARGGGGPDIAWFRDPAGNVLSVFTER